MPRTVMKTEDGSGTGSSRLTPGFGGLPAEASSHPPCVVAPMDACRYWFVSVAIWVASGLLPSDTLKTFGSPLL